MDPCAFKYIGRDARELPELQGLVVVEVDDLLCVGNEAHDKVLARLQEKFTFGKFVNLQDQKEGASFNGRRIRALPEGGYALLRCHF